MKKQFKNKRLWDCEKNKKLPGLELQCNKLSQHVLEVWYQ